MNKRERVKNAMDKRPVDHVPVGFWHHFAPDKSLGEACAQAHVDYFRSTDLDFIKVQATNYFAYPLPKIEKASDWRKLRPIGRDDPYIRDQVWRAKRIVELTGGECCVFYTLFAPFSSIRFGSSDELVMRHLREDELSVRHALDVIAQDNALLGELLITEAGCDGVYFCVQGGEESRMDGETYRRAVMPSDRYVLDRANWYSDYNILHCCGYGGEKNRLAIWKDYPAKAVNWAVHVEELPLPEGRELFGNRCCLGGFATLHMHDNVYSGLIHSGTKEEIRAETRRIILDHGKRGLMLGGDCVLSPDIPDERIRWIVEAARSI